MKLPTAERLGVQSLGRKSTEGVRAQSQAAANAGAVETKMLRAIEGIAADFAKREDDWNLNEQVMGLSKDTREFQAEHYAKTHYSSQDPGVGQAVAQTQQSGAVTLPLDDNIPAYRVRPALEAQFMEESIEKRASMIRNPALRQEFVARAQEEADKKNLENILWADQEQQAYLTESFNTSLEEAVQAQDYAAIDLLVDNFDYATNEEKEELREKAKDGALTVWFESMEMSRNPDDITTARQLLNDPEVEVPAGIDRQEMINQYDRRLAVLGSERIADIEREIARNTTDAYARQQDGKLTLAEVEKRHKLFREDPDAPMSLEYQDYLNLRGRIIADQLKAAKTGQLVSMGAYPKLLNPDNPDHRKAADAYIDNSPDMSVDDAVNYTIESNIMPQKVQDFMSITLLNPPDAEAAAYALDQFNRIERSGSIANRDLGPQVTEQYRVANALYMTGVPAFNALKDSAELMVMSPAEKQQRIDDYKATEDVEEDNVTQLRKWMDDDEGLYGFGVGAADPWFSKPQAVAGMRGEYNDKVRHYYTLTGNLTIARKAAISDMKQNWSPSSVGAQLDDDGEIKAGQTTAMKHAPARRLGTTDAVVQDALSAFAEANGFDASRIIVRTDNRTEREDSWSFLIYNEDGTVSSAPVNPETGLALRFRPRQWLAKGEGDRRSKELQEAKEKRDNALLDATIWEGLTADAIYQQQAE